MLCGFSELSAIVSLTNPCLERDSKHLGVAALGPDRADVAAADAKRFYKLLDMHMPRWQQRKARLDSMAEILLNS